MCAHGRGWCVWGPGEGGGGQAVWIKLSLTSRTARRLGLDGHVCELQIVVDCLDWLKAPPPPALARPPPPGSWVLGMPCTGPARKRLWWRCTASAALGKLSYGSYAC
jgi:hypothetical protein